VKAERRRVDAEQRARIEVPDSWVDDIVFDTNDATEAGSTTLLHRGGAEDGTVPCESWSFAGPLDSQSRGSYCTDRYATASRG